MNTTNIRLTNTFLFVKDIEISKRFYIENLDQEIQQNLEGYIVFTSGLALWELPEDSIIARKLQDQLTKDSNNRVELYFETDDVDMYFSRLKNKQIDFLHEIHEEPWGQRDFRFFDPDNNLIEIGEAMDNVALRLYDSGMTVEQIEAKTGMNNRYLHELIMNSPNRTKTVKPNYNNSISKQN